MSSDRLNPSSYVVLGLVGRDGASPHDIAAMLRRSTLYWAAAESQYYAEPKRLEKLGYLSSHRAPGKTRERTLYRLTDAGTAALREWLPEPAPFPRIQNEAAIRLLAGEVVDDEDIVASLAGLRRDIERLSGELDEAERIAAELPHRTKHLMLCHWLGRRLLELHGEWADHVERELRR